MRTGFSLVEVMVTLLIISIVMLGLSVLQATSLKESFDASQRTHATWLVQDRKDFR
jgi:prepilin-type N-terminal cleavage/methylation domain-containing protein